MCHFDDELAVAGGVVVAVPDGVVAGAEGAGFGAATVGSTVSFVIVTGFFGAPGLLPVTPAVPILDTTSSPLVT